MKKKLITLFLALTLCLSPQAAATAQAVSEPQEITIVMAGDMLLHTPVEQASLQADGSYNYDAIFANVASDIADADIAIANQEVIIGGSQLGVSGYPAFNAPYEFGDELVDTGFDVICHGTNHCLDKGRQGLVNCLNYWETAHPDIQVLGINDSQADYDNICIYQPAGTDVKIAILNYTYGTNGISEPADMPYAVDYLDEAKVKADLQAAEQLADFTIVCPHWGTEYSLTTDASQKKWAQIFTAGGADLIIGTHPHVIEPIEWYRDETTGRRALIYYSLGNFVNWTSGTGAGVSNRMVGGLAQVTLAVDNGQVYIKSHDVEPIVSHVTSGAGGVTVYRLSDYTEELANANEIRKQAGDFSLSYCQKLVSQVWGK